MNEPSPELSVIMCTLDGAETIGGALDSLAAQDTDVVWELVVSDNGCSDGTLDVVRSHTLGDGALIVDSSDVRGLAHARNVGVAVSSGRFVAFLDDDDEIAPDWVTAITRAVRNDRYVGSRMEYAALNGSSQMEGRAPFQSESLGSLFGHTVVNGACAIERELWDLVDGNDETLTHTGEDFDFSIRVQRASGITPTLARDATYHHRQRLTTPAAFRQGWRYGYGHAQLWARYGDRRTAADRRWTRHMWWWVVTRAPFRLWSPRRITWARQLGLRLGRLHGSIVERRWYP